MVGTIHFTNTDSTSPLQHLLMTHATSPISMVIRLYSPNFDPRYPEDTILGYLSESIPTLCALRLVSYRFKRWTQSVEKLMWEKVYFTYPPIAKFLYDTNSLDYAALESVKPHIQHLHIKVVPIKNTSQLPKKPVLNGVLRITRLEQITVTLLPETLSKSSASSFLDISADDGQSNQLWTWQNHNISSIKTMHSSHHRPLIQLCEALEGLTLHYDRSQP